MRIPSSFEGRFTHKYMQNKIRWEYYYTRSCPGTRPSINYQSLLKHRDIGPNKLTHAPNKPTYSSYLVYDRSHILSGTCLHGLFHSHDDDDQKNGMPHACSCSFDPTNTWDGRSMGWTNEISFMCAHTRPNWNVRSAHMWNVLFQTPFAQSVEIYTTPMEYYWTTLPRWKFGNTPFNTCTNDHGQRWCVYNFLLAFFKPSKLYFRSRTMG